MLDSDPRAIDAIVESLPPGQRAAVIDEISHIVRSEERRPAWVPHRHTRRQLAFADLECEEALFGGAAGGGKSDALLSWAAEGVETPGYSAVLFRRTFPELWQSGGLIPRSQEWFGATPARWNGSARQWTFPSGATIAFKHLQYEKSVYALQGGEYIRAGFDELTHFTETQYTYVMSRLRRVRGFPYQPSIRAASNPGGIGHQWVKRRFISEDAIEALRRGDSNRIFWNDGRAFVPSLLRDNPYLDRGEYEKMLWHLPPVTRERLLNGDWSVVEDAVIFAEWLRYYKLRGHVLQLYDGDENIAFEIDDRECMRIATADTAGTSEDRVRESKGKSPSWSVIAVWDVIPGGRFGSHMVLRHVWRERVSFGDLVEAFREVNATWQPNRFCCENAHFGPAVANVLQNEFPVELLSSRPHVFRAGQGAKTTGKLQRATTLLNKLKNGQVFLPVENASWRGPLESEWLSWQGTDEETCDQIDVASYAALECDNLVPAATQMDERYWRESRGRGRRIALDVMTAPGRRVF